HSGSRRSVFRKRLTVGERAGGPDPRARRDRAQTGSGGARCADHRGSGPARLRGDVVAGLLRSRQDVVRDRQEDQRGRACRACRSGGGGKGAADRLCPDRLDARGARHHAQGRNRQMACRDQGCRAQDGMTLGAPMIDRRRLIATSAAAVLSPVVTGRACAQSSAWPNRYVRLVVPFPPGGGTDAIARVVSAKLSGMRGQQMVVETRGGGATNIGTEAVARAEPDGYTILLQSMPLVVNQFLFPSIPYDPVADLAPISLLCDYPNIMAVPNSSPAHSVKEFI